MDRRQLQQEMAEALTDSHGRCQIWSAAMLQAPGSRAAAERNLEGFSINYWLGRCEGLRLMIEIVDGIPTFGSGPIRRDFHIKAKGPTRDTLRLVVDCLTWETRQTLEALDRALMNGKSASDLNEELKGMPGAYSGSRIGRGGLPFEADDKVRPLFDHFAGRLEALQQFGRAIGELTLPSQNDRWNP